MKYKLLIPTLSLCVFLGFPQLLIAQTTDASDTSVKPAITGADIPTDKEVIEADPSLPALQIEVTGNVEQLPESYPESWIMVDEAAFFNMSAGKVIIVDVAEPRASKRIKGIIDKSLIGNFAQSKTRGELYILETFHARGTRGPKEDVLAIYDKTTLTIKKEIVWPNSNRLTALPNRFSMSLSGDERFLYASNFDPAASFTVIDLDTLEITAEIGTPGCVLTFPVGQRAVASLCSNGSMLTTLIDDQGQIVSQNRSEPFFDTDTTPIFEHPVYIDGIAYFWSFKGQLHSFDMSGDEAEYLGIWDARNQADIDGNWRPSGLVFNDVDGDGNMYSIFQPDGAEGTQTHGGVKVRVYDPVNKSLVREIDTPNWAISIAVTRGNNPLLVVTNGELALDVFDAQTGEFIHTVSDFGNSTPLSLHKAY
ncbi:hypothetical protein N9060_01520 [Arenicella sp.]|nr:hypothetical protein [Arenicella sp.]